MPKMSQTSVIAAGLLIGYIVFITMRGELPLYLGVMGLGSQVVNPASATTTAPTSSAPASSSTSGNLSSYFSSFLGTGTSNTQASTQGAQVGTDLSHYFSGLTGSIN